LFLTRHGQTLFNVLFGATRVDPGISDPVLTAEGRAQARALALTFRAGGVRRLMASPYRRALETAAIIAETVKVPVTVDARIRERAAFACDVGTPRAALAREFPQFTFATFSEIWWSEGEEPESDFHRRCAEFGSAVAHDRDWPAMAVITHWGVVRSLTGLRITNGQIVRYDPVERSLTDRPHDVVPARI